MELIHFQNILKQSSRLEAAPTNQSCLCGSGFQPRKDSSLQLYMQARPGTYALIMRCSSEQQVEVGKLGRLQLRPGFYVYVGSAFGPGGLKARIAHHMKISDKPHWHMDYLRPALVLREIWFTYDSRHREHQWAGALARIDDGTIALSGFGASDCRCISHLYFIRSKPSVRRFRDQLRANLSRHGRIFIHKLE